jgi:hypothetical protein
MLLKQHEIHTRQQYTDLCARENRGNCRPIHLSGQQHIEQYLLEEDMSDMNTHKHTLIRTATIVLLNCQAILGLFLGVSLLARLLAPGSPIIISGAAIFAGPAGGASLVVVLASPILAWGLWMAKPWAHMRTVLLELIWLGIGAFELVFEFVKPDVTRGACFTIMGIAILILLCLYAGPSIRALSQA